MSLLDGPDVLDVYAETSGTDSDGNPIRKPALTPTSVTGRVQPLSATESAALGQQATTTVRVLAREWPAGAWSRVEWDSREWDVVGEPQRYRGSSTTSHVSVILRARA